MNPAKREKIFKILARTHGSPSTELNFQSNFELLVAVILSAQAAQMTQSGSSIFGSGFLTLVTGL